MARLGNICTISASSEHLHSDLLWLLNLDMIEQQTGNIISYNYVPENKLTGSIIQFDAKNVLYSKLRPNLNKVVLPEKGGFATSELLPLCPDPAVLDRDYLAAYLRSDHFVSWAVSKTSGAKMPRLGTKELLNKDVPLPPLVEQRKIAAVLAKTSDLIDLRKQQLEKLDSLVNARFVEMFGNFVFEKNRWETCIVGDVAGTVDPQPSHRTPPAVADGIPYIGIAECNYSTLQVDFENARKVSQDVLDEHLNRYTLADGDFIIGKIGTIGKPFFIPCKQNYTLSANTVLIQPDSCKVYPNFLFSLFQSEYMDRIIDSEKKSTSQPAFGIQKVRAIEIPLPPMKLQKQYADFCKQIDKSKLTVQHSLEQLQILKKSLMQQYFG